MVVYIYNWSTSPATLKTTHGNPYGNHVDDYYLRNFYFSSSISLIDTELIIGDTNNGKKIDIKTHTFVSLYKYILASTGAVYFYSGESSSGVWTLAVTFSFFDTTDEAQYMAAGTGFSVSITHSNQPGVEYEAVASDQYSGLLTLFKRVGGVWRFVPSQNCPVTGSDSGSHVIAVATPGIISCGVSGTGNTFPTIYLLDLNRLICLQF